MDAAGGRVIDAAAWAPRSVQQAVSKSATGWTVSYKDALKKIQRKQQATVTVYQAEWARGCSGNHNSEPFFEQMADSQAEVERLRLKCRTAANAAASRTQEQRPNVGRFEEHVTVAEQASEIARSSLGQSEHAVEPRPESLSTRGIADGGGLPGYLGHLHVPKGVFVPPGHPGSALLLKDHFSIPGSIGESEDAPITAMDLNLRLASASEEMREKTESASPDSTAFGHSPSPDLESHRHCPQSLDQPLPAEQVHDDEAPGPADQAERARLEGQPVARADDEEDALSEDTDDGWPPKPPLMRFKVVTKFSEHFTPNDDGLSALAKQNRANSASLFQHANQDRPVTDMFVAWFNTKFAMDVKTEFEFEVFLPVMILTIMDAIYPNKVPWNRVDWRFQYKTVFQRNFTVLERLWQEVNMEKARGFRIIDTPLRLEDMENASMQDRFAFLRLLKKWFDARIHSAPDFDPMQRRYQLVNKCALQGHRVEFPSWVPFDKDNVTARASPTITEFDAMPEYKRLIWFMGCPEIQSM